MKNALSALILFSLLSVGVAQGQQSVYEGESYYGDWRVYSDGLNLGDGSGENELWLRATPEWCYDEGVSYRTMNRYVQSNWPNPVNWWVSETCWNRPAGSHMIRVCVQASWGGWACSTYFDRGWHH